MNIDMDTIDKINNNEDKYKEYPDEEKIYMIDSRRIL